MIDNSKRFRRILSFRGRATRLEFNVIIGVLVFMTIILALYDFFVDYENLGIGYLIITILDAIAMLGIANSEADLFTGEKSASEYDAISKAES